MLGEDCPVRSFYIVMEDLILPGEVNCEFEELSIWPLIELLVQLMAYKANTSKVLVQEHKIAENIETNLTQGPESRERDWKFAVIPLI